MAAGDNAIIHWIMDLLDFIKLALQLVDEHVDSQSRAIAGLDETMYMPWGTCIIAVLEREVIHIRFFTSQLFSNKPIHNMDHIKFIVSDTVSYKCEIGSGKLFSFL